MTSCHGPSRHSGPFAEIYPDDNYIGLYFDQEDTIDGICTEDIIQAYLILVTPTFDAIKGLEYYLDWDESTTSFMGMEMPYEGRNYGDHHNVFLGFPLAMPTTAATVMATYHLQPQGPETCFTLGAARPTSIEGNTPVVVDGNENMFQIDVVTCPDCVCAVINPPVDAQSKTWGEVKSLYR